MKSPKVLIIILNYGTYDLTLNLIEQVRSNLGYDNYDIMVIDNCSPNESAKVLELKSKEINFKFIANLKNTGYAAGNNIGIRYGIENGYDYSWILNNDVDLREKSILSSLVEIAEKNESVGCVGPKIYSLDGSVCAPYCRRPSFWSMTGGIWSEKRHRQRFIDVSGEVYRVYGCCMLLKNRVMSLIDCMDERTFLYGEEDILAERMLKKGYTSYYLSEVSVTHRGSSSAKKMSTNLKKLQIKETGNSMELYLKEYRKFPLFARLLCRWTRGLIFLLR